MLTVVQQRGAVCTCIRVKWEGFLGEPTSYRAGDGDHGGLAESVDKQGRLRVYRRGRRQVKSF